MATKPYDYNELSTVRCQVKGPKCKGFIKKNVLARQPNATSCFKCTPAGKRDADKKRRRKMNKEANAAGIPIQHD